MLGSPFTSSHADLVQLHLRYGMILFIASEVMFFVAWFWAFFNALALFPLDGRSGSATCGRLRARKCWIRSAFLAQHIDPALFRFTVTWAHHSLIHGDRDGLNKGL